MAGAGPLTAPGARRAQPASRERYVREWLRNQAASGYVTYDADGRRLHAAARAGDGAGRRGQPRLRPRRLPPGQLGSTRTASRSPSAFRDRRGFRLARARPGLFLGTEQFFRPGYRAHLSRSGSRRSTASRRSSRGREGRRHRLRSRRLDGADGGGVPEARGPRLRLPRRRRSNARAMLRPRRASTTPTSRSPRRRTTRARATTSSASSTACTTWATRSAPSTHVRDTARRRRHGDARRAVRRRQRSPTT